MILQSLKEYYDRKASDPESGIAPEGFEQKEIPFVIVLDSEGGFIQIEDTRRQVGKQLRAKVFLVPQSVKRSGNVKPNLLWDNAEYVFGVPVKNDPKVVSIQHAEFIKRIKDLDISDDEGVSAVLKFLTSSPATVLATSEHCTEIKESNSFLAFRINGDAGLVSEREAVINKITASPVSGRQGICLVTGDVDTIATLQPSIKGVRDTNTTGGNIVSFNKDSFNSFGKNQGENSPIGLKASFAYTTALNYLLRKDSLQKLQVGDTTVVFWSDKRSHLENSFALFLNEPPRDDPDALTNAIAALLKAVDTGAMPAEDSGTRFFVLGLSPNAARISIRIWQVGTVAEFSYHIAQHFKDLEICHAPHERDYLSMWWLLTRIAAQSKTENIPPNLAGDWMRTIIAGLPYPDSLFQATLRRIQAEREVSYARAAIIRAFLNRKHRMSLTIEKEITVSLDKENKNSGYRLGRLFAVLEKVQEEAQPNINATIRDRYYSAASGTPASVMPILMRTKNHHLAKLSDKSKTYFEKLLGEIIDGFDGVEGEFPPQLNLQDQGRFAIGYYHQRQDFFTKRENSTTEQGE